MGNMAKSSRCTAKQTRKHKKLKYAIIIVIIIIKTPKSRNILDYFLIAISSADNVQFSKIMWFHVCPLKILDGLYKFNN